MASNHLGVFYGAMLIPGAFAAGWVIDTLCRILGV